MPLVQKRVMTICRLETSRCALHAGRLFFDLLNEPDAFDMLWGKPSYHPNGGMYAAVPPWGALYTEAADTLLQQEPQLLFLVEGTGQNKQPGSAYGKSTLGCKDLDINFMHSRVSST